MNAARQLKPQGKLFILYKVSNWLIFDPSCKDVYLIVVSVTYIRGTEEYDLCNKEVELNISSRGKPSVCIFRFSEDVEFLLSNDLYIFEE